MRAQKSLYKYKNTQKIVQFKCLRAHLPRYFRAYVLTCQSALGAYVFTFKRALSPVPHMACVTT